MSRIYPFELIADGDSNDENLGLTSDSIDSGGVLQSDTYELEDGQVSSSHAFTSTEGVQALEEVIISTASALTSLADESGISMEDVAQEVAIQQASDGFGIGDEQTTVNIALVPIPDEHGIGYESGKVAIAATFKNEAQGVASESITVDIETSQSLSHAISKLTRAYEVAGKFASDVTIVVEIDGN